MIKDEIKIGTYVYLHHRPQNIGKITKIGGPHYPGTDIPNVIVRWMKPRKEKSEEFIWAIYLNSFNTLIADHRKKLETHIKNLEKAKLILG